MSTAISQNSQVSPSNIMGAPVFFNNRIYVTGGGDFWWGKTEAWAQCIDATLTGDITETGHVWSRSLAPTRLHDTRSLRRHGRSSATWDARSIAWMPTRAKNSGRTR